MKKLLLPLIIIITQASTNGCFSNEIATAPVGVVEEKIEDLGDLETIIHRALAEFDVPGAAVGIVYDQKIIYSKGFGYRDLDKQLPVTVKTLFAIGSCSKAFTTFVLGTLVDKGLINWDDPVIKHLPEFKLSDDYITQKVTIRDLVSHRSGLARHEFMWYNSPLSRHELLERLQHLDFAYGFREKFQYNNLMYMVAGLVVEKVTGHSWESEVRGKIFGPIGMSRSNLCVEDTKKCRDFSYPYTKRSEQVIQIPFRNVSAMGPAGSINSSVEDMIKWVKLNLSDGKFGEFEIIKESTLNEIHSTHMAINQYPKDRDILLGYGLGWVISSYGGSYLVEHDGGIDGFISNVSLLPKQKIGVVILTNSMDGGAYFAECVSKSIIDRLLGLETVDWVANLSSEKEFAEKEIFEKSKIIAHEGTTTSHQLGDYVGEYENPGYGIVRIAKRGEKLIATYNNIETPLDHKHYDIFLGSKDAKDPVLTNTHFSFQTCCDGDIEELHISFDEAPIVFKKSSFPAGEIY